MKKINNLTLLLVAFLSITTVSWGQTDLVRWNNPDLTPTIVGSNITAGNMTTASGSIANEQWTLPKFFINGNWPAGTINTSRYVQFTISPQAGYQINLSQFNFRFKSTGDQTLQVRYSKDPSFSSYYTLVGATTYSGWTYSPDVYFNAAINPVLPTETVYIRVYVYQTNQGNLHIQRTGVSTPTITGTVSSIATTPTATNDSATTTQNFSANINILNNDTYSILNAITITQQPANGQNITVNGLTNVTYTPNTNYTGTDSFKYTITDENGTSNEATVNITVDSPVAPMAVADIASVEENGVIDINVLTNDTSGSGAFDEVMIVTNPANGTVQVNPDNTVKYTPNTNYIGMDSFQYNVSNIHNTTSNTVTVTIDIYYNPVDLVRWGNTNQTPTVVATDMSASNLTNSSGNSGISEHTADCGFEVRVNEFNAGTYNAGRYFQFSVTPDLGYIVDLSEFVFRYSRSAVNANNVRIRYSKQADFSSGVQELNATNLAVGEHTITLNFPSNTVVNSGETLYFRFHIHGVQDNDWWTAFCLRNTGSSSPHQGPTLRGVVRSASTSDIAISKTVNNDQPEVNDNITFIIEVTNNGPDDATGVTVTDVLPNGYTYVDSSASVGSYNSGTGIWTIGNLNDTDSEELTITATVLGSGTHNNTASVTANQPDSTPGNNSDMAIVTPNIPTADLKITKTVDEDEPSISENITFTLLVTNDGPDDATGVTVTDQLPNGYAYVSHSTATGTYNQGTGEWVIGNLADGNSVTLTITATVLDFGSYINTATVIANENDPVPGNNTDSETPTVGYGTTDLEIEKFASHHQEINQYTFFTIIVRNNGPVAATNVLVEDNLNSSWNFVNPSSNYQVSHGTVTATGIQNRNIGWEIPYIPSGGAVILLFRAQNNYNDWETWPQGRNNTATITSMDQTDSNNTNNSDTVTSVVHYPAHIHELEVAKSVSPVNPYIGQEVEFTIEIEKTGTANSGPDYLQLLDKLPSGYTYVSSSVTIGSYNSSTGIWTVGTPYDWTGTETLTITAIVNAPTGQPDEYKNVAAIFGQVAFPDTAINNNMDSVTIPIPIADPNGTDLQLTKTVDEDEPMAMDDVVFTITVHNNGLNPATGVAVTDFLPSGYDYVSNIPSIGSYNRNTGIWTIGNLAVSATATLEITATVLAYGDYENTASVSANQTDNIPSNNFDSVTVTPDLSNAVDLTITKEVDNPTPDILEDVEFTIEVENVSTVNATGVMVTDVIPSGYNFVSATGGATYNPVNRTVTWNAGNLAASGTDSFKIIAEVRANGNHINMASVSADQPDTDHDNDTDSASVTPDTSNAVDLRVTQSVSTETPNIGSNVTFTITAANNGPMPATGGVVNTMLANGLQFVSATPSIGSYNSGIWTIGNMAASATATLTITATVLAPIGAAYLSIAEITGNETDFDNNIINNISYSILSPVGQQFLGCDVNAEDPVFTEDFGSGASPYAGGLTAGRTNLIYQQGQNIEDGEYTVAKNAMFGYDNWKNISDASGNPNGYFMIINADLEPHEFFRIRITLSEEYCTNTRYNVNFKVANVNSQMNFDHCTNNEGGLILPEIGYFIQNNEGEVLGAGTSGEISYNAVAEWFDKEFVFISGMDDQWVELVFFNKAPGGCGNDLAIDDIVISACMTPPIRLEMVIENEKLEICGGEKVILGVDYESDLQYQWPPEAWGGELGIVEYQWQRSEDQITWVNISGETEDEYIIESFQQEDQAYYRLLYAQEGNINKASCRFPSAQYYPVFNATPVLSEIESEVEEEELCVGEGPFQFISEYDFSDDYYDWDEEYPYFLWESLNPSIATIDQNGMLTPVAPGPITIKYTVYSPKAVCDSFTQKTFIIRDEECNPPPTPKMLISNPHIRQRTK